MDSLTLSCVVCPLGLYAALATCCMRFGRRLCGFGVFVVCLVSLLLLCVVVSCCCWLLCVVVV